MGKKPGQVCKAPAKAPEPPSDEKPAKKPKGHRQRGAGTIITAPPPVTTNDGITLAPHMRLPFTLLQEYCQREKRPRPNYEPRTRGFPDGEFRYCVKLSDGKNSRNDLSFTPNQSCESEKMAKDYAALLALHHFQPDIPLERKLPEPYCTTWKDLVTSAAAAAKASSAAKGKSFAAAKSMESAGAPVIATAAPASGALNPSAKNPTATDVTPTVSGSVTTAGAGTTTSGNSGISLRAPPKALVGLQSDRKYVSVAEKEQLSLKKKASSSVDTSYAEVTEVK
jgi:hypothetical protein